MLAPAGIEPTSKVPETFVLSIERQGHDDEQEHRPHCGAHFAIESVKMSSADVRYVATCPWGMVIRGG